MKRFNVARPARADMALNRRHAIAAVMAWGASALAGATEPVPVAPLFEGMGAYRATDVSQSALARRYFEQGMVFAWGFNPAESARSFAGALRDDPACAAAAWGLAWTLGPTINADMAPSDGAQVDAALRQARALAPRASRRWRDLIGALSTRHPIAGTTQVDEEAYARRMRILARQHPADADVAALAAEAAMNLHPYDWWRIDGRPQVWTGAIVDQLSHALTLAPEHPGANHQWIHLMERSPTPERARVQADRLTTLVPGCGHLLHMPAHIYMRLGRYADASAANERSIAADLRYLAQVDAQGAYRVGYVAHNHHFLWASAAMQGRSARALEAATAAYPAACGPRPGDLRSGTLQHYQVLPLYALVRFGRWQEILTRTLPPDGNQPYPLAIWHYARGMALARTGRTADARAALDALDTVAADPALAAAKVKQVNAAAALVRIAQLTLQADLAAVDGRLDASVGALKQATRIEDGLEHDEPHLWLAPTRHALGATLLDAGHAREAEQVFASDLKHYPDNGWSLKGLALAQQAQGRVLAARATEARRTVAWRDADVDLERPRF
jgi:tetratricopeptide (TPR) repeat protein